MAVLYLYASMKQNVVDSTTSKAEARAEMWPYRSDEGSKAASKLSDVQGL